MQRRFASRFCVRAIFFGLCLALTPTWCFAARAAQGHQLAGGASHYGGKFHGRKTASGSRYHVGGMTAAHRSLPFGTRVRVTHARSGRSVAVRITDRGPFIAGRVIDLTPRAFQALAPLGAGVVPVRLSIAEPR